MWNGRGGASGGEGKGLECIPDRDRKIKPAMTRREYTQQTTTNVTYTKRRNTKPLVDCSHLTLVICQTRSDCCVLVWCVL